VRTSEDSAPRLKPGSRASTYGATESRSLPVPRAKRVAEECQVRIGRRSIRKRTSAPLKGVSYRRSGAGMKASAIFKTKSSRSVFSASCEVLLCPSYGSFHTDSKGGSSRAGGPGRRLRCGKRRRVCQGSRLRGIWRCARRFSGGRRSACCRGHWPAFAGLLFRVE
jgi:hypothetical protein